MGLNIIEISAHNVGVLLAADVIVDVDHTGAEVELDVAVVHPVGTQQVPIQLQYPQADFMPLFLPHQHVAGGSPVDVLVEHFVAQGREHLVHLFSQVLPLIQIQLIAGRILPSPHLAPLAVDAGHVELLLQDPVLLPG